MRRTAMFSSGSFEEVMRLPVLAAVWAVAVTGAGLGWCTGSFVLNAGSPRVAYLYEKRCGSEQWTGPHTVQASTSTDARQHLRKAYPGCRIKTYRPA